MCCGIEVQYAEFIYLFTLFTNIFRLDGPITINVFYLSAQYAQYWKKHRVSSVCYRLLVYIGICPIYHLGMTEYY